MKLVRKIIESKAPHFNFVSPESTVLEALRVMNRENLSYVIVMEDKKYRGLMSEKDYARKVILNGKHSEDTLVKDIMDGVFHYVDIDDSSDECLAMMNNFKVRYLPVLEDYCFRGIITLHDIMREIYSEKLNDHVIALMSPEYE